MKYKIIEVILSQPEDASYETWVIAFWQGGFEVIEELLAGVENV